MKNNKTVSTIKTIVLSAALAATLNTVIGVTAQAATGSLDPVTYGKLQQQKRSLQSKEIDLLRDKDDLLRQIDDLKRRGDYDSAGTLNSLSDSFEQTCSSLQKTQMDIRDVNRRLM